MKFRYESNPDQTPSLLLKLCNVAEVLPHRFPIGTIKEVLSLLLDSASNLLELQKSEDDDFCSLFVVKETLDGILARWLPSTADLHFIAVTTKGLFLLEEKFNYPDLVCNAD